MRLWKSRRSRRGPLKARKKTPPKTVRTFEPYLVSEQARYDFEHDDMRRWYSSGPYPRASFEPTVNYPPPPPQPLRSQFIILRADPLSPWILPMFDPPPRGGERCEG